MSFREDHPCLAILRESRTRKGFLMAMTRPCDALLLPPELLVAWGRALRAFCLDRQVEKGPIKKKTLNPEPHTPGRNLKVGFGGLDCKVTLVGQTITLFNHDFGSKDVSLGFPTRFLNIIVNFCYQQSYSLAEIVISTGVPNPLEFPQTRTFCLGIPTVRVFLGYIDAGSCVKTTFYFVGFWVPSI